MAFIYFLKKAFWCDSPSSANHTGWLKSLVLFCCIWNKSSPKGVESVRPSWEVNPSSRIEVFAPPQLLGEITGEWCCGWLANLDRSVVKLARESISKAQQFHFISKHGDQPEILYLKLDFNLLWFHAHANICCSVMVIDCWKGKNKFIYVENYLLKCLWYKRWFVGLVVFNYIYQL